jgi:hypothetical protein
MPADSTTSIGANKPKLTINTHTGKFKRHEQAVAIHSIKKTHANRFNNSNRGMPVDSATSIDVNKPKFTISNLIPTESYTYVQAKV